MGGKESLWEGMKALGGQESVWEGRKGQYNVWEGRRGQDITLKVGGKGEGMRAYGRAGECRRVHQRAWDHMGRLKRACERVYGRA